MRTVTIRYTVNSTNDKAPHAEEPRDRETITRGSGAAVGRVTGPLTAAKLTRRARESGWARCRVLGRMLGARAARRLSREPLALFLVAIGCLIVIWLRRRFSL
jgi:urea transporter